MNVTNRTKILQYISQEDYFKGKNYYYDYVDYLGKTNANSELNDYIFSVESERTSERYKCVITMTELAQIDKISCTCRQFILTDSCKHIAACFHNYEDVIFSIDEVNKNKMLTDQIFNEFLKEKRLFPKQEVKLELELFSSYSESSEDFIIEVKAKIGIDKMYMLKAQKLSILIQLIKNDDDENLDFGKGFTFNCSKNYFSKSNLEILDFLDNKERYNRGSMYSYYYTINNNFQYINQNSKDLINLLKTKKYTINDNHILDVIEGFPFEINLKKSNEKFELDFDFNNTYPLTTDLTYIQKDNVIYKINEKKAELLTSLFKNNLTKLVFEADKINVFSKSVLPIIKDNLVIDDGITEIVLSKKPIPKLYFDLYFNKVICNIKFIYTDLIIDYFDVNNNVLRDEEYEEEVLNDILFYKFILEDKKLFIQNSDEIGEFLENYLLEITEKYETYTSKKIQNMKVIKTSNISSTFSIGKDNIMSYSFDFDNISKNEIDDVLDALKSRKKYYHLKNGNLIDLEQNNNLKELENLTQEMELKNLKDSEGEIPKYRAIYIDSLKSSKFKNVVKTNNLFDELVNKFNSYKDNDITLPKHDLSILRDYQLTGVKWLYNIYKTGFGGILADEMGLGKSIQTIYFIRQVIKEDKNSKFLIVVPTSLAYNWEREFEKFGKNLKYKVIVGSRTNRRQIFDDINNVNIFITTYGLLREDKDYFKEINFNSIIIDEAQNIKNPTTNITKTVKSMKSESMIALTGTPIENSLAELWSIFDFIMPGFLSNLTNFNSKYKVKEFDENTDILLATLNKQISPFILRRKKIDVMKELPEKIENNIYIELSTIQKQLYIAELDRVNKEIDKQLDEGGMTKVRFLILQLLTKLRQICIDPRIVFENYDGDSEKINTLVEIIKNSISNNHKILIFTSFKTALNLVKKELDKNKISNYVIDGSVSSKKRMDLVDNFNKNDTKVFLIMLKAGGTGLNLTGADVVIHLDLWWNPQAENQATDRAHRIGQENKVEVIKLITKGTIEEKIFNLQQKKKILSDKIIDSNERDKNLLSTLNENDLRDLLSFENRN